MNNTTLFDDYYYDDEYDFEYNQPEECFLVFEISRFTVSFLTLLFNITLVSCFCREKKLRGTATKTLLFSLSICDLITGLNVCLLTICYRWRFVLPVEIVISLDCFRLFLTKVYVMHLCGLTLDRYISLFCALRYKAIVTKARKVFCMVITWLLPFIFTSIRIVWLLKYKITIELWYSLIGFLIFLAIPSILLSIAFSKMFLEIRRIKSSHPVGFVPTLSTSKEFRLIATFSFMYFTFLIVAMPYFSIRFWINLSAIKGNSFMMDRGTLQFILVAKDITSIFNPICYTLITPEVRKTIHKNIFRHDCPYIFGRTRLLDIDQERQTSSNLSSMQTCF